MFLSGRTVPACAWLTREHEKREVIRDEQAESYFTQERKHVALLTSDAVFDREGRRRVYAAWFSSCAGIG